MHSACHIEGELHPRNRLGGELAHLAFYKFVFVTASNSLYCFPAWRLPETRHGRNRDRRQGREGLS